MHLTGDMFLAQGAEPHASFNSFGYYFLGSAPPVNSFDDFSEAKYSL